MESDFFEGPWIEEMNTAGKLLYAYFIISTPNLCGLIEKTLARMSFETGIERAELLHLLQKFEEDGKIRRFESDTFLLVNSIKRQVSTSFKVRKKLGKDIALVSNQEIIDTLLAILDTLCIPYEYGIAPEGYKGDRVYIPLAGARTGSSHPIPSHPTHTKAKQTKGAPARSKAQANSGRDTINSSFSSQGKEREIREIVKQGKKCQVICGPTGSLKGNHKEGCPLRRET